MKKEASFYRNCIEKSESICWKISDVLPDDFLIEFDKNFLPSNITCEDQLTFLSKSEKKDLNQIWGASYFNIFAFVEEYITTFSLSIANDSSFKDTDKLRAFVRFSEEEIKHQQLFRKYLGKFNDSFKVECEFIRDEREVASTILSNTQLCVLILTYHLELITQQHYRDSVQSSDEIDGKFKEILKSHWLEETQHARLDLQKIKEEASQVTAEDFLSSIGEYFSIVDAFTALLKIQVEMNFNSLVKCSRDRVTPFTDDNKKEFVERQHQAYVDLFINRGFENKTFLNEIEKISPKALSLIGEKHEQMLDLYGQTYSEVG